MLKRIVLEVVIISAIWWGVFLLTSPCAAEIPETVVEPSIHEITSDELNDENIILLINNTRHSLGLPLVKLETRLDAAAQAKAEDMATKVYFSHTTPEGFKARKFAHMERYWFHMLGEILSVSSTGASNTHDKWLNSPSHYKVMVNPNYVDVGVGIAYGDYMDAKNRPYIAVYFGEPKAYQMEPNKY